jgi:hypothetical protein
MASPPMTPGWAGILFTVTANIRAVDDPQTLLAITETFPLVVLAVTLIELVVEAPVQPEGSVHV